MNELSSMVVQEEARLKQQGNLSVHFMTQESKKKKWKPEKGKKTNAPLKENGHAHAPLIHKKDNDRCHFYRMSGHYQNECPKRKAWFEKKGESLVLICFELNLVEVPSNTWWINSDANIHVFNTMQGYLSTRKPNPTQRFISMGNSNKAEVLAIGTYHLILDSGFCLDLFQTLYVPSLRRNIILLSKSVDWIFVVMVLIYTISVSVYFKILFMLFLIF